MANPQGQKAQSPYPRAKRINIFLHLLSIQGRAALPKGAVFCVQVFKPFYCYLILWREKEIAEAWKTACSPTEERARAFEFHSICWDSDTICGVTPNPFLSSQWHEL